MKLKIFILIAAVILISAASSPHFAHAVACTQNSNSDQICNPTPWDNVPQLLLAAMQWFLAITGVLSVLFVVIGGFQYATSAGNDESAKKGQKTITYALAGLVIALISFTVVRIVANTLAKQVGNNTPTGTTRPPATTPPGTTPPGTPGPTGGPTADTCDVFRPIQIRVSASTVAFGNSITLTPDMGGIPPQCKSFEIDVAAVSASDPNASSKVITTGTADAVPINVPFTDGSIFTNAGSYVVTVSYLSLPSRVPFGKENVSINVTK